MRTELQQKIISHVNEAEIEKRDYILKKLKEYVIVSFDNTIRSAEKRYKLVDSFYMYYSDDLKFDFNIDRSEYVSLLENVLIELGFYVIRDRALRFEIKVNEENLIGGAKEMYNQHKVRVNDLINNTKKSLIEKCEVVKKKIENNDYEYAVYKEYMRIYVEFDFPENFIDESHGEFYYEVISEFFVKLGLTFERYLEKKLQFTMQLD